MSKRALAGALFLSCLAAAGLPACDSDRASHDRSAAPAVASLGQAGQGGPGAGNPGAPSPAAAPAHRAIPCRAVAADGEVGYDTQPGVALRAQSELDGDGWMSLGPGARLVAKDPRTTRETTFRGRARVRPCVDDREESWLAAGEFESNVGAGESPGAEEWVVTPLGVVRYASAKLAVEAFAHRRVKTSPAPAKSSDHAEHPATKQPMVMREGVRIAVTEGVGFLWTTADVSVRGVDAGAAPSPADEGWVRIADGVAVLDPNATRSPVEAAQAALATCSTLGKAAHDLATALLEGSDASLAQVAVRQVMERRLARAACAVAALRVDAIPAAEDAAAKDSAEKSLHDALALWRELPVAQ